MGSYPPEMLAFLLRGSQEQVEVILDNAREAFKLRHRLHNLRKAMRKQKHEQLDQVESVSLSIEDNKIIAQPKDRRFIEALIKAGIRADSNIAPVTIVPALVEKEEQEELAELNALNKLLFNTEVKKDAAN